MERRWVSTTHTRTNLKLITMLKWINNELVEITYDKIDYWTMFVEGDLSLEELLKFIKEK